MCSDPLLPLRLATVLQGTKAHVSGQFVVERPIERYQYLSPQLPTPSSASGADRRLETRPSRRALVPLGTGDLHTLLVPDTLLHWNLADCYSKPGRATQTTLGPMCGSDPQRPTSPSPPLVEIEYAGGLCTAAHWQAVASAQVPVEVRAAWVVVTARPGSFDRGTY